MNMILKQINKTQLINAIKAIPDNVINIIFKEGDSKIYIKGRQTEVTITSNTRR